MVPPDSLILLAGFVFANAAWSVSDLPKGDLLVPQAIAEGKATLTHRQAQLDAWAFGREGLMPEGTGKVDVLTVDAWAQGMARPITFVQRFRPYSSGAFRIKGDAMVVVDGKALGGTEAARVLSRLYDSVRQHPKAGPLWHGWRVK